MQGPSLIYSPAEAHGGFTDGFVLFAAGIPPGSVGVITVAVGVSGTLGATGYGGGGFDDGLGRGAGSQWWAHVDLHWNNDGLVWEGNQSVFVDAGGSIPGGNAALACGCSPSRCLLRSARQPTPASDTPCPGRASFRWSTPTARPSPASAP